MKTDDIVIQIANLTQGTRRNNPNTFRVYDQRGIAPTIVTYGGVTENR